MIFFPLINIHAFLPGLLDCAPPQPVNLSTTCHSFPWWFGGYVSTPFWAKYYQMVIMTVLFLSEDALMRNESSACWVFLWKFRLNAQLSVSLGFWWCKASCVGFKDLPFLSCMPASLAMWWLTLQVTSCWLMNASWGWHRGRPKPAVESFSVCSALPHTDWQTELMFIQQ